MSEPDDQLLDLLRCPEDQSRLSRADAQLVAEVNRRIYEALVVNRAGQTVRQPIAAGLVRADRRWLYPIVDEIPVLLTEEAIALDFLEDQEGTPEYP